MATVQTLGAWNATSFASDARPLTLIKTQLQAACKQSKIKEPGRQNNNTNDKLAVKIRSITEHAITSTQYAITSAQHTITSICYAINLHDMQQDLHSVQTRLHHIK